MSVRLQFSATRSIVSNAIAWFSAGSGNKRLSHVDIVLRDGTLLGARADVICGIPAGVQIRPKDYGKETWINRVVFELAATPDQEQAFFQFALEQVLKPYDRMAILGFLFGRAWREDDCWECAELVCAALEQAGLCRELYLAASRITPEACALVVSALGAHVLTDKELSDVALSY